MPKSSIASRTPISFSSSSSARIRSLSPSRRDSVSSSSSAEGGRPDSRRACRTLSTKPGSRNWRADTLTETCGPSPAARCRAAGGSPAAPPDQVGQRLPQHPGAERHDVPGLLRERDELAGQHHAPARVRPADQRLEAGDLAAVQGHDRLVGEGERGVLDGVLERRLHLAPPQHARCSAPAGSCRQRRLPAAFAAYRARSAWRSSSSDVRAVLRGGDADGRGRRAPRPR